MKRTADTCSHCGRCTRNCVFLGRYNIDLSDLEANHSDLSRRCMLCGVCSEVCPEGIDGAGLVLAMRERNKGPSLKQLPTVLEKKHYLFRNYPAKVAKTLLFVGCSFPSFFPRTMLRLRALAEEYDFQIAYDCCGKPLAELGRKGDAQRICGEIAAYLEKLSVRELVTVCPNCQGYLQERLPIPVVSIYQKLTEWGCSGGRPTPAGHLFRPCPDRREGQLGTQIGQVLDLSGLEPIKGVQCCGLGGGAAAYGADVTLKLVGRLQEQIRGPLYTYCASCAGQWRRLGFKDVRHLLPYLLNIEEAPDISHSLRNRWKSKNLKN